MSNTDYVRKELKQKLSSRYGMMLSSDKLSEAYNRGATHAVIREIAPDEILDGTDKTLCMYDYAKEILEITNG